MITEVPLIVDAGVGTASDATLAMELGFDGVLMNTAIAAAQDPILMAEAMKHGVLAGRKAFLAGRMAKQPLRHCQLPAGRHQQVGYEWQTQSIVETGIFNGFVPELNPSSRYVGVFHDWEEKKAREKLARLAFCTQCGADNINGCLHCKTTIEDDKEYRSERGLPIAVLVANHFHGRRLPLQLQGNIPMSLKD